MDKAFFPERDVSLIRNGSVEFSGALLVVDISGFTAITEILAASGKNGTEALTTLLNKFFDKMITVTEQYNGSIITFSGDSMLVRFQQEKNAKSCAKTMLDAMKHFRNLSILEYEFSLKAKVVLGIGRWNQYIIGDNKNSHIILSGKLIRKLASTEENASPETITSFYLDEPVTTTLLQFPPTDNRAFISPGSQRLFGEHRSVTAVFLSVHTDESGFKVIQDFHDLCLDISKSLAKYGGYLHHIDDILEKGSKILILFGAPVSYGDDTVNSLLAMINIFSVIEGKYSFNLSCGIDTGYVFSGILGNEKRKQYTVIGDSVNTAARLSDSTVNGTINVSESVYNRTRSHFSFKELDSITVKGKNNRLRRFKPIQRLTSHFSSIPFVGREKELEKITELIKKSESRILFSGNAGIGKSTFVNKLSKSLRDSGYTVKKCGKTKHGPPNEILTTLVCDICDLSGNTDKVLLEQQLHDFLELTEKEQIITRELFIARMLFGIKSEDKTFDSLPPKLRRENLIEAITLLLQELPLPTCIIVEDIHYSDLEELKSLQEVMIMSQRISEGLLSFVLTTRPTEEDFFKDDTGVYKFNLEGLSEKDSYELLAGIALGKEIEKQILTVLVKRSQGNPFFLVQFFLYLKEKNLIQFINNKWEKSCDSSLESLPESIFSMIMARIDSLSELTRESLKIASVVGVKFEENLLYRIISRNVHTDLVESSDAGLTFVSNITELEYIFSHMLIRDVAYESILLERRRQIHKDIGYILENNLSKEKDLNRILAYHFINAEEWRMAIKYSIEAGAIAVDEYRNQEAIKFFEDAIRMITSFHPEQREELAKCYSSIGGVKELIGEYSEAIDFYKKIPDLSTDLSLVGRSLLNYADVIYAQGKLDEGMSIIENLENRLIKGKNTDRTLDLGIAAYRAWVYCITGKLDLAMAEALTSVRISESLTGISECYRAKKIGHALNTLATVYWASGQYSKAKDLYERAIVIANANNLKREAALTYGNIGLVLQKLGKFKEASLGMEKKLSMATAIGEKLLILSAHGELATNHAALGNYKEAIFHGKKQMNLAKSIGAIHDMLLAYSHLGLVYNEIGKIEESSNYTNKGLSILPDDASFDREKAHLLVVQAHNRLSEGLVDAALEIFHEAQAIAVATNSSMQLGIYLYISKCLLLKNEVLLSEEVLEKAFKLLEKSENENYKASYAFALSEHLVTKGDIHQGIKVFEDGVLIIKEMDTKPALARAYQSFAKTIIELKLENRIEFEFNKYMKKAEILYREMNMPEEADKCISYKKTGSV